MDKWIMSDIVLKGLTEGPLNQNANNENHYLTKYVIVKGITKEELKNYIEVLQLRLDYTDYGVCPNDDWERVNKIMMDFLGDESK